MSDDKNSYNRTGILSADPPKRSGKIIPKIGGSLKPTPPSIRDDIPDWELSKVPKAMDPNTVFSIESIPELFETIERIMTSLSKLNAEFLLSGENFPDVWLVPTYTPKERCSRREISFEDAAKLVVLVSAFGGEVKSMRFLDNE